MRQMILTMLLCLISACTVAADKPNTAPDKQEQAAVLSELSQRSGLLKSELNDLLADCNANQRSMYFCAWRDQIVADRAFERALAERQHKMPQCKMRIKNEVANWTNSRDRSCEKSATKEWGEGSMKATAQAICVTAATVQMTGRLQHMTGCAFK